MKCKSCGNEIKRSFSTAHKQRNKNFYCDKECYLKYARREKLQNAGFFEKIDTEARAYWLGFIYADGNLHSKNKVLQINLSAKDAEHLQKFADIFDRKAPVRTYKSKGVDRDYAILSLPSSRLWNDLYSKGIKPRKTFSQDVSVFDHVPDHLMHHFIRGLFDGDGSVCQSAKKITNYTFSICGPLSFMSKAQELIIMHTLVSKTKIEERESLSVIRWSGHDQLYVIYQWLYANAILFLHRKENKFRKIISKPHNRGGSSKFRGVAWHKNNSKWLASISYDKKRINLGYYKDEELAARAYDVAAVHYNKPLCKLNFS